MPPIDQARIAEYLERSRPDNRPAVKGQALQDLTEYMFAQVPGVEFRGARAMPDFRSEEIDLGVTNRRADHGLALFPELLLIECKNWTRRVGPMEVAWFATKLRRRRQDTGILIAAQGITGTATEHTGASFEVGQCLSEGQRIVVLTRDEISHLVSGEQLALLLEKKQADITLYRRIYVASPAEMEAFQQQVDAPPEEEDEQPAQARGLGRFEELVRQERERAIRAVLAERPETPPSVEAGIVQIRQNFDALQQTAREHKEDDEHDPRWQEVRDALVDFGASCAAIVHVPGAVPFERSDETMMFDVLVDTPGRFPVKLNTELWPLTIEYLIKQMQDPTELMRHQAAALAIGFATNEIINIDDYEPEPEY